MIPMRYHMRLTSVLNCLINLFLSFELNASENHYILPNIEHRDSGIYIIKVTVFKTPYYHNQNAKDNPLNINCPLFVPP